MCLRSAVSASVQSEYEWPVRAAASSSAMLGPAGAEAIPAQDRPSDLWFERHRVGLAALIANDLEAFAFALTATASLLRTAKVCTARVAARLAALRVT
jgi:hypothetical protein